MPGVVRILTAGDVPGFRGTGLTDPDTPVFVAEGEVTCCVSDFLAMVVADTQFHAREAAKKVKVDYEVLEPVTDPFKALEPGAPLVHSSETFGPRPSNLLQPVTAYRRGDVDAALKNAAHIVEGTWRTQSIDPAFLEPEACLVLPRGRGVVVHTESQGSVHDQQQIAKVLNVAPEDVEIAAGRQRRRFWRERRAIDPGPHGPRRAPPGPAGQDGSDAGAVHPASREAPPDDGDAYRRR